MRYSINEPLNLKYLSVYSTIFPGMTRSISRPKLSVHSHPSSHLVQDRHSKSTTTSPVAKKKRKGKKRLNKATQWMHRSSDLGVVRSPALLCDGGQCIGTSFAFGFSPPRPEPLFFKDFQGKKNLLEKMCTSFPFISTSPVTDTLQLRCAALPLLCLLPANLPISEHL